MGFEGLKDVDEWIFGTDIFLLRNSPGVVFIVTTKNGAQLPNPMEGCIRYKLNVG